MNEQLSVSSPTTVDRRYAAAFLRALADRIEAEDGAQPPRLRLDTAQIEINQELLDPVEVDAFPVQRVIQRHVGEAMTLRLHWRLA